MSITISICFRAGRYHATPWGRHVNEGQVEWPPSPWRLVRALIAVWKRACADLSEEQVRRVLTPLVAPPSFQLPPHRVAHTRHYMPWEKKGPSDRTLVLDTFVAVSRKAATLVHWPHADLNAEDRTALGRLVGSLTWLGRAEAWIEADLLPESSSASSAASWNCVPREPLEASGRSDLTPVFCPNPATAFGSEYYPAPPDAKKLKKGLTPEERTFAAPRWHLCLDTQTLHERKWPQMPGAQWTTYERIAATPPPSASRVRLRLAADGKKPQVVQLLIDAPAGDVLPHVTNTLQFAEGIRRAAMSKFGRWCQTQSVAVRSEFLRPTGEYSSPVLSGKQSDETLRRDDGDAYFLPTTGADPTRLTALTVFAENGFGPGEMAAFAALREIKWYKHGWQRGVMKHHVRLIGVGQPGDFRDHWLFQTASVWESATPFVAHRHWKRRDERSARSEDLAAGTRANFAACAARELAELRKVGSVISVEPVLPRRGAPHFAEYRRARDLGDADRHRGGSGYDRACALVRITFTSPVAGPLCLGYASHFGLGLFRPAEI